MSGVSLNGTRLVQILAGLRAPDKRLPPLNLPGGRASAGRFSERLGQLIDFSDSIAISEAHGTGPARAFQAGTASTEHITGEFQRVRDSMVRSVRRCCTPGGGPSRVKLPLRGDLDLEAPAADPYLKFYSAQQREIAHRVHNLTARIREDVAGLSPAMARLVAVDTALGNTLAAHTRQYFAEIPALLATHFEQVRRDNPGLPEAVLEQFCAQLRELLLAEIETRLLPALGLIEAINENSDRKSYE